MGSNPTGCIEEMMDWFNSTLTYSEAIELLSRSHEERVEMESKNLWDAYVNDFSFGIFVRDAFYAMESDMRNDIKGEIGYQYLPKVSDFLTLIDFANEDEELNKPMREVLMMQFPEKPIWLNVEAWWENLFRQCFSEEHND